MADQVSSLVFKVDATSVKDGKDALDALTASADKAEQSTKKIDGKALGNTLADVARNSKDASQAMDSLAKASLSLSPTPIALVSAAVLSLGAAIYKGSQEFNNYSTAISISGNYAGVTASQLQQMAKQVSSVDGTVGKAAQTLTAFVKSGSVTRDMLVQATQAAQTWEKATGESVDETIRHFQELQRDPVDAIRKLTEQYNFLDTATLQRIQSLERQGQQEQAAALAQKTYADAIQQRGNEIITNLGYVQRAWNTLAGIAKSAWDAMMGIGRTDGTAQALQAAEERLIQLQDGAYQRGAANRVRQVEEQRKIVEGLRQQLKAEQDAAKAEGDRQAAEKKGQEGLMSLNRLRDQYASQEQKRQKLLRDAQNDYNDAISAPSLTGAQRNQIEKDYQNIVTEINKQFDKRAQSQINSNNYAQSLLEKLRGINAQLAEQVGSDEKIGTAAKRLIEYETKFADLKEKRILTTQDKLLLSQESQVMALLREGAELERTITKREALLKLTERANSAMASLQSSAENRAEQYAREESVFGLGDRIRKQVEAENSIRREFNRAQTQLTKNVNLGLIDPDELEKRQQAIRDLQAQELDNTRQHFSRMESLEQDWTKSFQESISNAADSMRTAFQIAGAATNVVFQNMTEGLTTFVTTGKLNFKDLTVSILNGLAQIAVQAAASKIFSLVGSLFNPTVSASYVSTGNALNYLPGRANGGPVQANSMYRVNERGPELYSENGKTYLMAGGNGGYVTPISNNSTPVSSGSGGVEVSVYVSGDGNNRTDTNNDAYRGLGDEIGRLVDQRIQQMQVRSYRPGGLSWSANNGRLA